MSQKFKDSLFCYLIDHHSPQPPAVPLGNLDPREYEDFFRESHVDSQMVYCKDHWGVTYYPSKVPGARQHEGVRGDWIATVKEILSCLQIEFVAYYCIEYDEGAARRFPEWRVRQWDGSPLLREDTYARWSLCCTQTGYRQYCLDQLREIVENYSPDALFLDIFGSSLCYCDTCRERFLQKFGYELPPVDQMPAAVRADVLAFLNENTRDFYTEIKTLLKGIDPTLAITVNFSCHYPAMVRDQLDYQFSEPLLKDNWFSAAYARDTAVGQYPILAPGEASQVYNYSHLNQYRFDLMSIAAQGCRVGMYSGSQHADGTLDFEEARRLGAVYRELDGLRGHLRDRAPVKCIGIIQSDASMAIQKGRLQADAILRAKRHNPHIDAILGAMQLCENAKLPWSILPGDTVTREALEEYDLLLLPEVFCVTQALCDALDGYVRAGGKVLASGGCGRFGRDGRELESPPLFALLGVQPGAVCDRYGRNGWQAYLTQTAQGRFTGLLESTTPPVGSAFVQAVCRGADPLLEYRLPCVEVTDDLWVNWWSPPPGEHSGLPALTTYQAGQGTGLYASFDLFGMAAQERYPYLDELFAQLLARLEICPSIRLDTPTPRLLRTAFFQREGELLVYQLSCIPHLFGGETAPVSGGALAVDGTRYKVTGARLVHPDAAPLKVHRSGTDYVLELPAFEMGQVVVIAHE